MEASTEDQNAVSNAKNVDDINERAVIYKTGNREIELSYLKATETERASLTLSVYDTDDNTSDRPIFKHTFSSCEVPFLRQFFNSLE